MTIAYAIFAKRPPLAVNTTAVAGKGCRIAPSAASAMPRECPSHCHGTLAIPELLPMQVAVW